jgi:hypothetical protein
MPNPAIVPDSISGPPADLSDASRAMWVGLAGDLVTLGRASEAALCVLADTLRLSERADALARAIAQEGATVAGSTGQRRPHPGIQVERELRRDVADRLRSLGLVEPNYSYRVGADGRIRDRQDKTP